MDSDRSVMMRGDAQPVGDFAHGGRAFYGASVGILMLETQFPRIPGDMGNVSTWPFPVQFRVVPGASPERVVKQRSQGLADAFIEVGQSLVRDGVDGIATTCGFLSLLQAELAAALQVPVASSALMQVPMVNAMLPPGRRCGVVTVSSADLTQAHLLAANAPSDTPVAGTEAGIELTRALVGNALTLDVAKAEAEVVGAAMTLVERHPELGAIVLECTNMPPYAAAVRRATGVPVYDIVSFVSWFHAGLAPRSYG